MIIKFFLGVLGCIFIYLVIHFSIPEEKKIYRQIKDIYHPTIEDYRLIQRFLKKGKRTQLKQLKDFEKRSRNFKLIGQLKDEIPESGTIYVNCHEDEKENCILLYASFNKNYAKGLQRLVEHIKKSDFKGAILYQIGGWPNAEAGDLTLAHVPYAFKVCFFREALQRGFKRALWLDTSIIPLVSLNEIFSKIKEQGYFAMGNSFNVGPFFNAKAAKFFKMSLNETFSIPSCSSGLYGLDFTDQRALKALSLWYLAASDPHAFFSARPDQNALSLILYQLNMHHLAPIETLAHGKDNIISSSLFLIERDFVQIK